MNPEINRLIDSFSSFPEVLAKVKGEPYTQYKIESGGAKSRFLYRYGEFVQLNEFIIEAGTDFPEHSHEEDEYALVVKGNDTILYKNNREVPMPVGHIEYTPAGVVHSAYFPERTIVLTITSPPSKDYSNGR